MLSYEESTLISEGSKSKWAEVYAKEVRSVWGQNPQVCTMNGLSLYITIDGFKVRFSDHGTGIGRSEAEVQVGLSSISNKELVLDLVERKNPDNYTLIETVKTLRNTEYGFKNLVGDNVEVTSKELVGVSKKGDDLFEFTYKKKSLKFKG